MRIRRTAAVAVVFLGLVGGGFVAPTAAQAAASDLPGATAHVYCIRTFSAERGWFWACSANKITD